MAGLRAICHTGKTDTKNLFNIRCELLSSRRAYDAAFPS